MPKSLLLLQLMHLLQLTRNTASLVYIACAVFTLGCLLPGCSHLLQGFKEHAFVFIPITSCMSRTTLDGDKR